MRTVKQDYEVTLTLTDGCGIDFAVSVQYNKTFPVYSEGKVDKIQWNRGRVSIESYELEGDNQSREELVERFGNEQINRLEEGAV